MPSSPRIDDAAILDATVAAMQRLGVRKLGLVDVAAQAGISRHTIYRRFRTKDELLDAVGDHLVQRCYDDLLAAVEHRPDPPARARVIVETVVRLTRELRLGTLIELEPAFYRRFVARDYDEWLEVFTRIFAWPDPPPASRARRAQFELAADAILRHSMSYNLVAPPDWDRASDALTSIVEGILRPARRRLASPV